MKKLTIITAILLGLLSNPVQSQKNENTFYSAKPVICGPIEDIISTSQSFEEVPIISGKGVTMLDNYTFSPSEYVIGYNKKTETWSLIEIMQTRNLACILGTGTELRIFSAKNKINL